MIEIIELHMIYEGYQQFSNISSQLYICNYFDIWRSQITIIKKEMINGGLQKDWFRKSEVNQEERGKVFIFLGIHQYKKNEMQRRVEIGRVR